MALQQTYEGTPTQLAEQLLLLPESKKYRMKLILEEGNEENDDDAESLEVAIARITNRTPEEILAARERLNASTPPPRDLPMGKTVLNVVMGTWPGDETDEQIIDALEKLS